jgi:hypothetical protein
VDISVGCNFIRFFFFFFVMLFSYWGIFGFVYIKEGCWRVLVSCSAAFRQHMWLTKVVEINLSPHCLMRLGVIFLPRWRVYDSEVCFGVNWHFFPFFSFSFFLGLRVGHVKNYISLSISFFLLIKLFFS